MKYDVEIGLVAMIYIYTKFHKDWFRHSKMNGEGIHRHTDNMVISYAYFNFFKIRKAGSKSCIF
jgi:hypothetical protein